jgi:hypothetical protein
MTLTMSQDEDKEFYDFRLKDNLPELKPSEVGPFDGPSFGSPPPSEYIPPASVLISRQPRMSSNPGTKLEWEWETRDGQRVWYTAAPRDINMASQTGILVSQGSGPNPKVCLTPVFYTHNASDSICHVEEERSAQVDELTKAINTIKLSACKEYRWGSYPAEIKSPWLYQACTSLANQMNLRLRFRPPLEVINVEAGHHFPYYSNIESQSAHCHTTLTTQERDRLYTHVKNANKKIGLESGSSVLGTREGD